MQRILFSKVEIWVVVLLAILAVVCAVLFGALVLGTERKTGPFGRLDRLGAAAVSVASLPETTIAVLTPDRSMAYRHGKRFDQIPTGWSFPDGKKPALDGYMLISRYDGTRQRPVVELMSLADFSILHEWLPDFDALLADVPRVSEVADYSNWTTARSRAIHPWAEPNGDLIVKDHYGPLFRLDACARKIWVQSDMMFSHATEPDGQGGFWVPGHPNGDRIYDKRLPTGFSDDSIAHVSADGHILTSKSLVALFGENGMKHLVYPPGAFDLDPIHVNDIEPVLTDGVLWKKGDLFLSFRIPSMIMLYRPSTNKVIWRKSGPWLSQHDVDILDDRRISVFNNNAVNFGMGPYVEGVSEPAIYDFEADEVIFPLRKAMEEHDVKTFSEGLIEQLPGGHSFIEEENSGRFLIVSASGAVVAQYVNRAEDGRVYRLGWSRYLSRDYGNTVRQAVQAAQCN